MAIDPDAKKEIDANRSAIDSLRSRVDSLESRVKVLENRKPDEPDEPTGPSDRKLIDADVLREHFVGKWGVKKHKASKWRKMGYSNGTHYIGSDGNIRLTTHTYDLRGLGVLKAPDFSGLSDAEREALRIEKRLKAIPRSTLIGWEEVPDPPNETNKSGIRINGLLEANGGLHYTYKAYYSVTGEDFPSQGFRDANGNHGLFTVDSDHPSTHNGVAGYLATLPPDITGDYGVGLSGSAGNATTPKGPALVLVSLDGIETKEPGDALSGKTLLYYPNDHNLDLWNEVTSIRGCAWIETSKFKGVLFSVRQGLGNVWYEGGSGYHADEYERQLWVYDPDDLRAVLAGELKPWHPRPIEKIGLKEYSVLDRPKEPVTLCYRDGRLTVFLADNYKEPGQNYELQPIGLEFWFGE